MKQRRASKQISNFTSHKTTLANLSPSANKTTKSPLSTSKCAHNIMNNQNVSYGQLQIVLDNIHQIRQKARLQVQNLNQDNRQLKQEITSLQTTITELTSKLTAETAFQGELQKKWKRRVQQVEEEKKRKQDYIEKQENHIRSFDQKMLNLQNLLNKQKDISASLQKQIKVQKQKWNWTFSILGDETRVQQLVWRVKNTNRNLWQIIQTYTNLSSTIQLKNQKIQSSAKQVADIKQLYKYSTQMLDKSLGQINLSNQKISTKQDQIKELNQKIKSLEKSIQQKDSLFLSVKKKEKTLHQQINELEQKVLFLSEELAAKQEEQIQKEKNKQFQNIVSQACQEREDYSRVLQRVRYLQKFRNQHYFNVEKIQYLCKLIDS